MTISDEMLGAYADGALGPEEQAMVERALADDAALRARLDAHRSLYAALSAHFAPVAEEPVPERLRALLQPQTKLVDLAAARQGRAEMAERRSLFRWPHYAGMAASLAVGLLAGQLAFGGGDPIGIEDGRMVARAGLARALDTQLASAPTASETRIGLTFADRQGRVCRTFDRADLSGIACHEDSAWRVAMTAAPSGAAGEYRQAGAPALLAEAENMMAAPPFDAAAEREARDARWRRD
jgi:hypothetical protein